MDNMEETRARIVVPQGMTLADLRKMVDSGGRFVVFPYCISLIAVTLKRFSPSVFVPAGGRTTSYVARYNTLSLIFGWWGIPWGPVFTLKYLSANMKGGVDVTDEIMLNIDEEALESGMCVFTKGSEWFAAPDKWDRKAMGKAITSVVERDTNVRKVVVGIYFPDELSPADETEEFRAVGIRCTKDFDKYADLIRTALGRQFRRDTIFRFFDLGDGGEMAVALEKHGLVIHEKKNM